MKKTTFIAMLAATSICAAPFAYAKIGELKADEFVKKASMSNLFEIESSKIAQSKATDPKVKEFAMQMIKDHTKAGEELKAAVAEDGLNSALIATSLDKDHQDKLNKLQEKTGEDFDQAYMDIQEDAHDKATSLFKEYKDEGDAAALKNFAATTLPVLKQHEEMSDKMD